jgi:hypothetical protein
MVGSLRDTLVKSTDLLTSSSLSLKKHLKITMVANISCIFIGAIITKKGLVVDAQTNQKDAEDNV